MIKYDRSAVTSHSMFYEVICNCSTLHNRAPEFLFARLLESRCRNFLNPAFSFDRISEGIARFGLSFREERENRWRHGREKSAGRMGDRERWRSRLLWTRGRRMYFWGRWVIRHPRVTHAHTRDEVLTLSRLRPRTRVRSISCTRVLFLFPPSSGLRNRLASVMPIFALATREESVLQAGRRLREIAAFCSLVLLRRRVFAEFWAVLIFGWL